MLRKTLISLAVIIAGFLLFVGSRPDRYRVERATVIDAPAAVVFAQLDDFRSWSAWSPWEQLDPQMKKTFEGPAEGVNASYSWQGNKKVGSGKMTIVESQPPRLIKYRLEFIEPFAAVSETQFVVTPQGERRSGASWSMEGTSNFMAKMWGVFVSMDGMIGADFERGLAALKTAAEAEAGRVPPPPPPAAASPPPPPPPAPPPVP